MKKKERIFWIAILIMLLSVVSIYATVTEKLEVAWDKRGPIYAIPTCSHVDARVLSATTAETFTVPDDAEYVMFGCVTAAGAAATFYADFSGTAAAPAADITNGSGSELNPYIRAIGTATSISVVAPADCIVTAQYYKSSF